MCLALPQCGQPPAEIKPFPLISVLSEQQRWDQNRVSWLEGQQPSSGDHSVGPALEDAAPTSRSQLQGGRDGRSRDCEGILPGARELA